MPDRDSAQWLLEVMNALHSPDADLIHDLLGHLACLRQGQSQSPCGLDPPSAPAPAESSAAGTYTADRDTAIRRRRQALYSGLRDQWRTVADLPRCLKQAQVLRQTALLAIHSQIVWDPLVEEPVVPLTIDRARGYASRALEIAEALGDQVEMIEAYLALANHEKLAARHDQATRLARQALTLAEGIGSLHHRSAVYGILHELLTLTDQNPETQISLWRSSLAVVEAQGDMLRLAIYREQLARVLILTGQLNIAAEELDKAGIAIGHIPPTEDVTIYANHVLGSYHRYRALLHHAQGRLPQAIEEMQRAVHGGMSSDRYRSYVLGTDLAFLEDLYLRLGDRVGFISFCEATRRNCSTPLQSWHLSAQHPAAIDAEAAELIDTTAPAGWCWIDPLQKGRHVMSDRLEITPFVGGGFLANVAAPRLMLDVDGDFVFEATLDGGEDPRRAGGILVYQDDQTLIRYGSGIDYDDEVTLAVKSTDQGFAVTGRGLLRGVRRALRIRRQADTFTTWGSDGDGWYRCGEARIGMRRQIQVGLFAECAYRDWFSTTRVTATPVSFTSARLATG